MTWSGSRRRLLALTGAGLAALAGRLPLGRAATPLLSDLTVDNGGRPFAGDNGLLTTLGSGSGRTAAHLRFWLALPSVVSLEVLQTHQGVASEQPVALSAEQLSGISARLAAGRQRLSWAPDPALPARTYILRATARPRGGPGRPVTAQAVARVLGVDAAFGVRSARPGETVALVVRTDARRLRLQLLQSGTEAVPTYANDLVNGLPVGVPSQHDWSANRNQPSAVPVQVGPDWPSGVYFARLEADDGRLGFAPLVVRPAAPARRVAVVLPTSTWHAYNFYDADGDGWGDTWYARWRTREADLTRPHPNRGVPFRYRSYDLAFQRWLAATGKAVDVYADEDLDAFPRPAALRAAYDLIVFPGHTEYVTERLYDLVEGFRDLGGNLMFLAANNFFRRVDRSSGRLTLVDEWRTLGRPESALLGVQYVASDRGERHAPFTVVGADVAPWAFDGTGLANGGQFGDYGIEIDARSPASPPGTQLLATIPDLFGPGRSAEMTYYEHPGGARVFSAGALNFGGQALLWPETRKLLENLWQRLA